MGKERKVWHDPLKSVRCESSWSVSVATVAGSGRLALIPPLRGWRRRASVRVSGMDGDRLAANWGSRCSAAYRRVAACVERGLLERLALLRDEPSLIRASREGLRYAGLGGLPVGVISPGAVEHWLRCASTALTLEAEFAGRVISERELVFAERLEGRPLASAKLGELPGGGPRLHRPDLVALCGSRAIAIEVELSPKAPRRLEAIMRAWRRADGVAEVRYYCAPGTTRRSELPEPPLSAAAGGRIQSNISGAARCHAGPVATGSVGTRPIAAGTVASYRLQKAAPGGVRAPAEGLTRGRTCFQWLTGTLRAAMRPSVPPRLPISPSPRAARSARLRARRPAPKDRPLIGG